MTSDPMIIFVIAWCSAMAGAVVAEYARRKWEARRGRTRYGRVSDGWQPRIDRGPLR